MRFYSGQKETCSKLTYVDAGNIKSLQINQIEPVLVVNVLKYVLRGSIQKFPKFKFCARMVMSTSKYR
jgi:hypothetical protein